MAKDQASTGPRSFERGIINFKIHPKLNKSLQRGRALSSAELRFKTLGEMPKAPASTGPRSFERGINPGENQADDPHARFNGAALFRARNYGVKIGDRVQLNCFNGAALFRARNSSWSCRSAASSASFNGAALFRARNYRRRFTG